MLTMHEIEKQAKRIMTTQTFCNNLLFTAQLFKMEQFMHYSVHLRYLFLILECST